MVKQPTIRVVLSLALHFGWQMKQLDVSNTFLYDRLDEVIYMQQPISFVDSQHPTHVCKLHKALYGLKQAPPACFLPSLFFTHLGLQTKLGC